MDKAFHLSTSNLNNKILYPRVPDNWMTKQGYEDNTIARVCFSNNYEGALIALGRNIKPGTRFFVHQVEDGVKITPNSVVQKHVPDAHITGEVWTTTKTRLKLVEIIEVVGYSGKEFTYTYGGNKQATLYGFKIKRLGLRPTDLIK